MTEDLIKERRGKALREARRNCHLSAKELVTRLNATEDSEKKLSEHAIYSYENGKVLLSSGIAQRIASLLRIHPSQLLIGDPEYVGSSQEIRELEAARPGYTAGRHDGIKNGELRATADDLLSVAERLIEISRAFLYGLESRRDRVVKPWEFGNQYWDLKARLNFATDTDFCRRAQNSSDYGPLTTMADYFDSLRQDVKEVWEEFEDTSLSAIESETESNIKVRRKLQDKLEEIIRNLEAHIHACREFRNAEHTERPAPSPLA